MPLVRFVLFLFLLSFSFETQAQSDTACVSKRWIAVKNTEANAVLFDTSTTILKAIRDLVESNKIMLYNTECRGYGDKEWYPIQSVENDTRRSDYQDYLAPDPGVFSIRVQSDMPYVDDYGDLLIQVDEYGNQMYVYDPPETYTFKLTEISEIRIREEHSFNEETGVFEGDFRATGISFHIKNTSEIRELFWVSIDELNNKIAHPTSYPWHSFLENKKYSGFQYMQVSCYDDLIRY